MFSINPTVNLHVVIAEACLAGQSSFEELTEKGLAQFDIPRTFTHFLQSADLGQSMRDYQLITPELAFPTLCCSSAQLLAEASAVKASVPFLAQKILGFDSQNCAGVRKMCIYVWSLKSSLEGVPPNISNWSLRVLILAEHRNLL